MFSIVAIARYTPRRQSHPVKVVTNQLVLVRVSWYHRSCSKAMDTNRACQWVSHYALFWKCQTHSVNDSVYDFELVFLEIPVENCIVGLLLTHLIECSWWCLSVFSSWLWILIVNQCINAIGRISIRPYNSLASIVDDDFLSDCIF